jgi:uncharacterized protein (TIGR02145 family)
MKTLFSFLLGLSVLQAQVKDVKIGTQVWMAKNLNVFYFKNGDAIPIVKTAEEWKKAGENKQPACCYYENNAENGKTYGLLYNWYAVNDARGLAPAGYHIPTEAEWTTLTTYLGGEKVAGTKMKSISGWKSYKGEAECNVCKSWTPEQKAGQTCTKCNDTRKTKAQISGNGTNSSGFNGLPGGFRDGFGTVYSIGYTGVWWSSTEFVTYNAWNHSLYYGYGDVISLDYNKGFGLSVRCIRD